MEAWKIGNFVKKLYKHEHLENSPRYLVKIIDGNNYSAM